MVQFPINPPTKAYAVTPDDDDNLANAGIIYVGTAGDVEIIALEDSSAVVIPNVPAGTFIPVAVKRVRAANTTASDLVCFYTPR